jgi:c-di-GMP-binding flagellar brake protein YcgR
LRTHQTVIIHFQLDGMRYGFRTRVLRHRLLIHLNADRRVVGMSVRIPQEICREQRRADFRVAVAGRGIEVRLYHADPPEYSPIDDEPIVGRVADLSAGGVRVLVERGDHAPFKLGDAYCVALVLPESESESESDAPLELPAEVRHLRDLHDGATKLVGLQFVRLDAVETRPQIRRIHRFVAAEQRRQLRSRR